MSFFLFLSLLCIADMSYSFCTSFITNCSYSKKLVQFKLQLRKKRKACNFEFTCIIFNTMFWIFALFSLIRLCSSICLYIKYLFFTICSMSMFAIWIFSVCLYLGGAARLCAPNKRLVFLCFLQQSLFRSAGMSPSSPFLIFQWQLPVNPEVQLLPSGCPPSQFHHMYEQAKANLGDVSVLWYNLEHYLE